MANRYLSTNEIANSALVTASMAGGPFNTCEVALIDRDIHIRLSGIKDSKGFKSTHYPASKAWDEDLPSDGSELEFILDGEEVLSSPIEILNALVTSHVSGWVFGQKALRVAG